MIPPELAWLIPVVLPFIIGILVGAVIKRTLKLIVLVVALVVILVAAGLVTLNFRDIFDRAMEFLPRLIDLGGGIKDVLPYSSVAFLVGLSLGLWRG